MCVNNLSRFAQPVELDLRRYEDWRPVELLGGVEFPMIGELPYFLTLTGHGFYWFDSSPRSRVWADRCIPISSPVAPEPALVRW